MEKYKKLQIFILTLLLVMIFPVAVYSADKTGRTIENSTIVETVKLENIEDSATFLARTVDYVDQLYLRYHTVADIESKLQQNTEIVEHNLIVYEILQDVDDVSVQLDAYQQEQQRIEDEKRLEEERRAEEARRQTETQSTTVEVPAYSIGIPGGQMKSYYEIFGDQIYDIQYYVDQGYIVKYGNYYAGHNPGVMSFLNWISYGDKVRIHNGDGYADYTVIDIITLNDNWYFQDVYFNNGVGLWDDVCFGPYHCVQFCIGGVNHLFLLN